MRRIEAGGITHEFPDEASDADISTALNGPLGNAVMEGWKKYVAKPASNFFDMLTASAVNQAREGLGESAESIRRYPAPRTPGINPLASLVETPAAALMTAGTIAGGPLAQSLRVAPALVRALGLSAPAAARLAPVVGRVGAGTVGAAGGGAISGEDPLMEGGKGLLGTILGEGAGTVLSMGARMLPGAKSFINRQDAARIGRAVGETSEPLSGQSTTLGLNRVIAGEPGQQALSGSRENWISQIETMVGQSPLLIPVLGRRPMPLREAQSALSKIGDIAFKEDPLAETLGAFWGPRELYGHKIDTMAQARQLYGEVRDQIAMALDAAQRTQHLGPRALPPIGGTVRRAGEAFTQRGIGPEPARRFEAGPMREGEIVDMTPLPPREPRTQPSDVRALMDLLSPQPLSQRGGIARTLEAGVESRPAGETAGEFFKARTPAGGGTGQMPPRPAFPPGAATEEGATFRPDFGEVGRQRLARQGQSELQGPLPREGAFPGPLADLPSKDVVLHDVQGVRELLNTPTRDYVSRPPVSAPTPNLPQVAGPRASAMFDSMQQEYAAGTTLRDIFQQRGLYQAQGDRMDLNMPMLQKSISQDPTFRDLLQWKLGPQGFARFEAAVMRGATEGADRPVQGTGQLGGPIVDWLAGRAPGAGITAAAPFRAFLPNMGSRYIGTKPLAIPPLLQQILDLAAQRGTEKMVTP